jgi:hypothetical protein
MDQWSKNGSFRPGEFWFRNEPREICPRQLSAIRLITIASVHKLEIAKNVLSSDQNHYNEFLRKSSSMVGYELITYNRAVRKETACAVFSKKSS